MLRNKARVSVAPFAVLGVTNLHHLLSTANPSRPLSCLPFPSPFSPLPTTVHAEELYFALSRVKGDKELAVNFPDDFEGTSWLEIDEAAHRYFPARTCCSETRVLPERHSHCSPALARPYHLQTTHRPFHPSCRVWDRYIHGEWLLRRLLCQQANGTSTCIDVSIFVIGDDEPRDEQLFLERVRACVASSRPSFCSASVHCVLLTPLTTMCQLTSRASSLRLSHSLGQTGSAKSKRGSRCLSFSRGKGECIMRRTARVAVTLHQLIILAASRSGGFLDFFVRLERDKHSRKTSPATGTKNSDPLANKGEALPSGAPLRLRLAASKQAAVASSPSRATVSTDPTAAAAASPDGNAGAGQRGDQEPLADTAGTAAATLTAATTSSSRPAASVATVLGAIAGATAASEASQQQPHAGKRGTASDLSPSKRAKQTRKGAKGRRGRATTKKASAVARTTASTTAPTTTSAAASTTVSAAAGAAAHTPAAVSAALAGMTVNTAAEPEPRPRCRATQNVSLAVQSSAPDTDETTPVTLVHWPGT